MNHTARRFRPRAGIMASMVLVSTALLSACTTAPTAQKFPDRYESPKVAPRAQPEPDLERIGLLNLQLAGSYYAAGQFQTAYGVIARAYMAQPANPQVLTMMALIEGELRDDVKARQHFDEALKIAPDDPDVRHNFGVYLCKKGQPAASIEHFQRAVKVPTYNRQANSLTAAGDCLAQMGRDEEAQQYYFGALRFDAAASQAMIGLAELKFRRGEFAAANQHVADFSRLSSPSPATLWLQIRLANKLGKPADVQSYGADLRRLFPASPYVKLLDSKQFD